jgi:hypothetical protein
MIELIATQKIIRIIKIIVFFQLFFGSIASGQVDSSENKRDIIKDFFQSKSVIDFLQSEKDSIISIIDVDSILIKAEIHKWGNKLLNIVSTGESVLKIKEKGIFCDFSEKDTFYIFASNKIDEVTYYRIFRPGTGADSHFGVIQKGKKYVVVKRKSGWF